MHSSHEEKGEAHMSTNVSEQPTAAQMRPVILASMTGTAIEWYDFFLYGTMASLVFPKLFFPETNLFVGTLLSFGTFFVGFLARPFGGALFGHLGDRIGRKATLITTLLLMGISTLLIGFLPTYSSSSDYSRHPTLRPGSGCRWGMGWFCPTGS